MENAQYLPRYCLAAHETSVLSPLAQSVASCAEKVRSPCSTKTLGGQRVGNLRKGQFSFIFYYLPLLLNSMGGAWGLWHCSQKHCPCQAEFAPSQVLIDCERKIWSPFGRDFLGRILHLPSGRGQDARKKEYLVLGSR